MCGLVGVAGDISQKDVDVFKQMLYVDYLRGEHSVGVGAVHSNTKEVRVRKATLDPLRFFELRSVTDVVNSLNLVLMGHNRHATRGVTNTVNAHPYHVGQILGAHNGTLDFSCERDLADNREASTDSEKIMATIDELDGDIAAAIALMEGAWALSIYDERDNTINLVRNEQRPLYYCMAESLKTLYWASEAWMLRGILLRNGIKIKDVVEISPNQILSWCVPANSREIFRDAPAVSKAEGKQRANFQNPTGLGYDPDEQPWMDWGRGPSNARGASRTANGSGSKRDGFGPDPDLWTEYGEGYTAADEGRLKTTNPYNMLDEPAKCERWLEGWKDGADWILEKEKRANAEAESDGNVVPLEPKRASSKRSTLYNTRGGPGNRRLTATQFREITKNECGWCNNPVVFEDKGQFVRTPAHGDLYVCETCVSDGEFQTEIKEAQASA